MALLGGRIDRIRIIFGSGPISALVSPCSSCFLWWTRGRRYCLWPLLALYARLHDRLVRFFVHLNFLNIAFVRNVGPSSNDSSSRVVVPPSPSSLHVAAGPCPACDQRVERRCTREHHALVLCRCLAGERRHVFRKRLGVEHASCRPIRRAGVPLPNGLVKLLGAFKLAHKVFHLRRVPI